MRINSHNGWDTLREVIVVSAVGTHAVITCPRPDSTPAALQQRVDEIEEDLDGTAATIRNFGATVHRPEVHDIRRKFVTPFWESKGNNSYNVRDLRLVAGDTVIESPSHAHSRFFEAYALYPIWYRYLEEGFRWIAAPKPRLETNSTELCNRGLGRMTPIDFETATARRTAIAA